LKILKDIRNRFQFMNQFLNEKNHSIGLLTNTRVMVS
jgi:hypothetical protein